MIEDVKHKFLESKGIACIVDDSWLESQPEYWNFCRDEITKRRDVELANLEKQRQILLDEGNRLSDLQAQRSRLVAEGFTNRDPELRDLSDQISATETGAMLTQSVCIVNVQSALQTLNQHIATCDANLSKLRYREALKNKRIPSTTNDDAKVTLHIG